ncbi:MAG: chromosomal replication initiator protein DnaA [Candidatus Daviesbacteria bacterium]|nr:chromosomal replication initiator protein DnaA [Candidatus Daviesbacteria bacterium]
MIAPSSLGLASTYPLHLMEKQWSKTLKILKNQVTLANYKTWFSKTALESVDEENIVINVPSGFIKQQLSTKYIDDLAKAVEESFGKSLHIELRVDSSLDTKGGISSEPDLELDFEVRAPDVSQTGLNPKYSIENFMVGLSNNLAYAAAQAVINNPGTSYNPLFIYGGTGVGKTHLMHAVGNALIQKNPHLKIIYCSSEKFMNDFIQSIQTKRTGDFRAKYRNCGLLLIDDVQFISGRDSTQEEFFHTFNELQAKNAQIILTSDRPPNEIQKLEGRLASRFQGGLMVDIQLPDFDTRIAIIKARCREKGDIVPEECIILIAELVETNARELEGKLMQIIQIAKLSNQELNPAFIRNYLGKPQPSSIKLDHKKVFSEINRYFNTKMADITGPRRKKELVLPRQLAMYLLYEECKIPYERIGDLLGGRDHTTILHGVDKIRTASGTDREIQRVLIELKQALTA